MAAEAGSFEAFYASSLQHPWLLWAAAAAALASCLRQRGLHPSVLRYCAALTALSAIDAWLTSSHVYGLGPLPAWASGPVPLFFVLAGDFRYLLLLEAAREPGRIVLERRSLARAALLTLPVPAFAQAVLWALPDSLSSARVLFLVYELAFLALVAGLWRWHPALRTVAWLRPVSAFVAVYYGLWAGADAILLATGSDWGFALRVVPNVLYYGGLIAAIGRAAARGRPAP